MGLVDDPVLEARCRALVGQVDLPRPFSVTALLQSVANHLGCVINSEQLPSGYGAEVSAAVIRTSEGYLIQHLGGEDDYSLLAICHELGHIMGDHFLVDDAATARLVPEGRITLSTAGPTTGAMAARLFDMHEAMRDWGPLYRCSMTEEIEVEAELTGTLLVQRIARHRSAHRSGITNDADRSGDEVLRRYASAMSPRSPVSGKGRHGPH